MPATAQRTVVPFARKTAKRNYVKPEPIPDSVFFHKGQVSVGTAFRYMGRLQPNTIWTVTEIVSHDQTAPGTYRRVRTNLVRKLKDTLKLVNRDTGERHEATFVYLSYSAIWRLN